MSNMSITPEGESNFDNPTNQINRHTHTRFGTLRLTVRAGLGSEVCESVLADAGNQLERIRTNPLRECNGSREKVKSLGSCNDIYFWEILRFVTSFKSPR